MMKIALLLSALFCLLPATLPAEQENTGQSDSGRVSYELRGAGDTRELWVWSDKEKAKAVKLCDSFGFGNLKVSFSPDDRWIIVRDGGPSLGITLRLFQRADDGKYEERKDANLDGKAELAALGRKDEIADHRYASCLAWSDDSRFVLISVSGKGDDGPNHVHFHWLGVYDLVSGKYGTDLSQMNASGVKRTPR